MHMITVDAAQMSELFVPWIPGNTMTAACDVAPPGLRTAATVVANSTAINELLRRILNRQTWKLELQTSPREV